MNHIEMNRIDTIVIGNGLFGSMITTGLRSIGQNVLLIGDRQPMAGSPPAACLINSAWTKKLGTPVIDRGMEFLTRHYNYQSLEFTETTQSGKTKQVAVGFVRPQEMLLEPDLEAHVHLVTHSEEGRLVGATTKAGLEFHAVAPQVVVAAGVWSQRLVPWVDLGLTGKYGCAFLFKGPELRFDSWHKQSNVMKYWAPYRQLVAFDRQDGIWVNDGSAIVERNWSSDHIAASRARVEQHLGLMRYEHELLVGIRPYTKAKPCLCSWVSPGLWVAVGAAKNGTLLGAYCASTIMEKSQ